MTLHIAFRVGGTDYVLPATQVLHLESFERATPVPGTPSFVAGVVHVRGRVVPVVDLRARFGLPSIEHTLDRRIVVVQVGRRTAALLVDSAREVLQLDETSFEKPPELVDEQAGGFVSAIATAKQRMFMLVDVPRIIGEELVHE